MALEWRKVGEEVLGGSSSPQLSRAAEFGISDKDNYENQSISSVIRRDSCSDSFVQETIAKNLVFHASLGL